MVEDLGWMYDGWKKGGGHMKEWMNKTKEFIDHAFSLANNGGVKCPCNRCRNSVCEDKRTLSLHFARPDSCQAMRCGFITASQFIKLH
jgi:hypothetical protein